MKELQEIMRIAGEVAVANYVRITEPRGDFIRLSEAKRWFKNIGLHPYEVTKMINRGEINILKGGGRNSSVWLSKSEILNVIGAKQINKILLENGQREESF